MLDLYANDSNLSQDIPRKTNYTPCELSYRNYGLLSTTCYCDCTIYEPLMAEDFTS